MIQTTLAPGAPWPEYRKEPFVFHETDAALVVLGYLANNPRSSQTEIIKGIGFDCTKTIRSMERRKKIVRHEVPTGRIRVRYSAA